MLHPLYAWLPDFVQPIVKRVYYRISPTQKPLDEVRQRFFVDLFGDIERFETYRRELDDPPRQVIHAREAFESKTKSQWSEHCDEFHKRLYAVIREHEPDIVVETGVSNGFSTLFILLALQQNGAGQLYSIDYPFRVGDSIDAFREETFEGYGGAALPADEDPGWIIPDELQERWELWLGKSQQKLPKLVGELDDIDLFLHDSEHSLPCMLFELELAWEWLSETGVVIVDDISWNDAFSLFVHVRDPPTHGLFTTAPRRGYLRPC